MSQNQLIVALDVGNLAAANQLVTTLSDDVKWFKIGKELFTAVGPASVKLLIEAKKNIFLDLKFHDIPNTVAGAVGSATKIGANIINIHAAGGLEMMRAAAEVAEKQVSELGSPKPTLLGVTILTSVNETNFQRDFGTERKLTDQVAYLAELSQIAGLDGVVASPLEIGLIRKVCGSDFVIVTPGVRPAWAASNDQQRVMTPAEAIDAGADYIVVGRPITAADNPRGAARTILQEINT